MQARQIHSHGGQRTFALVLDTGDEAMERIRQFAERERMAGAQVTGIGAFEKAVPRYFDWDAKEHRDIPDSEQVEVASLIVTESPAHLCRRKDAATGLNLIRLPEAAQS
uniref:PCC domain-containing protein n=1 Tax=Altererythrobacter segetis TaxID=1104773 RepID=UPI00140E3B31|nr:DUF296 domain-containing protein [Altererythrobacter segetis]